MGKRKKSIHDCIKYISDWERRFKRNCRNSGSEFYLSLFNDIEGIEFSEHNDLLQIEPYGDTWETARNKCRFLMDYLLFREMDQVDIEILTRSLFPLQSRFNCFKSYGLWFGHNNIGKMKYGRGIHFNGVEINLFCKDFTLVDFVDIHEIIPYNKIAVRRPNGEAWDVKKVDEFIAIFRNDILFDYADVKFKHYVNNCFLHFYSIRMIDH